MAFRTQQELSPPPSPTSSLSLSLNRCPLSTLTFSPYFEPTRLGIFHLRYLPFVLPGMLFPRMLQWLIPAFDSGLCSNVNSWRVPKHLIQNSLSPLHNHSVSPYSALFVFIVPEFYTHTHSCLSSTYVNGVGSGILFCSLPYHQHLE